MILPKILENKVRRPVAVFGAGVSGNAVARFLAEQGVPATIYDRSGVGGARENFTPEDAEAHDLVVHSPGFPLAHPWMRLARNAGALCLTEADFAALFWQASSAPAKLLDGEDAAAFMARLSSRLNLTAVTGTNGKTTLTEFLCFAHRKAGRVSVAVGNNGIPMTSMLFSEMPSIAHPICEISSFQAECLRYFSPRSVLWTNFDEDHIDRHGSRENYFRAKFRLVEQQNNLRALLGDFARDSEEARRILADRVCVVGESVAAAAREFGVALPDFVQVATREEVRGLVPEGSIFETFPQRENYALARRFWLARGFPLKELEDAARAFTPKEHRLALSAAVETPAGTRVEFWDDSKGTNFHAVYAALETFPDAPIFWVGGGLGKGGDTEAFCRRLAARVSAAFLIGETAPALAAGFAGTGVPAQVFENLGASVNAAFKAARNAGTPRAVVLFSPGFASFDMFKSYADRGRQFNRIAEELAGA